MKNRRTLVTAAAVIGALLGSAGIASAVTGSSTTTPPATITIDGAATNGASGPNEDPAHEASESPAREAQEHSGGFRGGHNEDPAHEASESPEREAQEHAGNGEATTPTSSASSSATAA